MRDAHLKNNPGGGREDLAQAVARIIAPAAFADLGPVEVTQRNVHGKAQAYSRPSDSDMLRAQEAAIEAAREVIDYLARRLHMDIEATIANYPPYRREGPVRRV